MKSRLINIIIWTFLIMLTFPLNIQAAGTASIAITVTLEQIETGVSVQAPENQPGDAGETLTYAFAVQNIGNNQDSYTLSATSSSGWEVSLPGGNEIGPLEIGETVAADVQVTIPSDALGGEEDQLTLTAISQTDTTIQDSGSVITTVNQVADVRVRVLTFILLGRPGETLTHRFRVQNIGNGVDTFDLEAVSSQGWIVNIPGGSTSGSLGVNESEEIEVEVVIPDDATPFTIDMLTLTATSQVNPEVSDSARAISVVIRARRMFPRRR